MGKMGAKSELTIGMRWVMGDGRTMQWDGISEQLSGLRQELAEVFERTDGNLELTCVEGTDGGCDC